MRIVITDEEYEILKDICNISLIDGKEIDCLSGILDKISQVQNKDISSKKISAAAKATKVRSDAAKKKIENAMNLMRLENRPVSVYLVSKEAGVSYNTANKYAHIIEPKL